MTAHFFLHSSYNLVSPKIWESLETLRMRLVFQSLSSVFTSCCASLLHYHLQPIINKLLIFFIIVDEFIFFIIIT